MQERLKDKYIDPFTDFGFKKLFGEECNKDLLLDFLNELLHKEEGKIVSITYLKNENLGVSEEARRAVFDIHCENEKGEKFIVEIQKTKQAFFKDRTLYYSTFPITRQAIPGDWSFELKAVYTIAILNFVFEDGKNDPDKYRYDVMLSDIETHKIFYDKLTFIYLEMPKFTKSAEELETHFEKWMYVLKNLKRLDNIPNKLREKIFEKMFSVAEVAKLSPDEYQAYIDSLNSYRDLQNSIETARAEEREKANRDLQNSIETARAEEREKANRDLQNSVNTAKAEGKAEGKNETALKMLEDGMSIETICKYTGLSSEQIKDLMQEIA